MPGRIQASSRVGPAPGDNDRHDTGAALPLQQLASITSQRTTAWAETAVEHDVTFVDVYSHVHRLPLEQREALYSPQWQHFSVAGNQLVADLIWEALGEHWQPRKLPVSDKVAKAIKEPMQQVPRGP
jgi:hypothetical protein